MKHTKFALAAALALSGAGASAGITGANGGIAANNAEMLLVVWSPTSESSYALDIGMTISQFNAISSVGGFSAAVTSAYVGTTLASAADARWAVLTYDTFGDPVPDPDDNQSLYTTVTKGSAFTPANPFLTADTLSNSISGWANFVAVTNTRGTNTSLANGAYLAPKTDAAAYFLDTSNNGGPTLSSNFAPGIGNVLGTASSFYRMSPTDIFDSSLPVTVQTFDGKWNFDGSTVTYTVAAIPEPGTYALLLAGLVAVGFVARRRG
jgi:hypothetical protein